MGCRVSEIHLFHLKGVRKMKRERKFLFGAILGLMCLEMPMHAVPRDNESAKKRDLLASVRRVVVIAPFFGTLTLGRVTLSDKKDGKEAKPLERKKAGAEAEANLLQYKEYLQKLEAHVATQLPERIEKRTPFEVVSGEELTTAFKELTLAPEKLFQNKGLLRGTRFASPDVSALSKLAKYLHADAILVGTMDEPRRSNGGYYLDMGGLGYNSASVRTKADFTLTLAEGTLVLHETLEVLHPLTKIGKRAFLLTDWIETQDQLIENLMDELIRYTPERKR